MCVRARERVCSLHVCECVCACANVYANVRARVLWAIVSGDIMCERPMAVGTSFMNPAIIGRVKNVAAIQNAAHRIVDG